MSKAVTIVATAAGAVVLTGLVSAHALPSGPRAARHAQVRPAQVSPAQVSPAQVSPAPSVPTAGTPTPSVPTTSTPAPPVPTTSTPAPTPTPTPTPTPPPKPPKPPEPPADFPAGPSQAPPCKGVVIEPTDNAAELIGKAAEGTTFCFAKGLHRITETLRPKANQTLGSDEGAILTGSIPLTQWRADNDDWVITGVLPPAYRRTGQCEDNVANVCYLREQLFLDGKHLKRVSSRGKVVEGTFYGDYAANAVYLGDDPRGRSVEMSKTATAIESSGTRVTVRGLTVEHFASAPQGGAVVLGPGWTVVANDIRWNHAVGAMLVNADGATLEKNLIRSNGQLGVGQYSSANGTITGNLVSDNNTDGFWIADWESGGIKTTWSSGGSVTKNLIRDNRGVGLWSDAYDDGRTFRGNEIAGNAADGIRFEIGRNGVIEDNLVTGNGFGTGRGSGTSLWDGGGINVNTSADVRVRKNTVAGNVNGISIQSRTRGSGPWGRNVLRNVEVSGNKVTMKGGTTATGMVQNSGAAVGAGEVVLTANKYYLDSLAADRFQKFGQWFTAAEWKQAGHDTDSTFLVGKIR